MVVSSNALNTRLGHVAVIPVTGTAGPETTHLRLTADAGLTAYDESYADVTALQAVSRDRFRNRRGLASSGELRHLEDMLRVYLGL